MSSQPAEKASTAVGLGDVHVSLKVAVQPGEVACELAFRGTTVTLVFAGDGAVHAVRLPPGAVPEITGGT